MGDIGDILRGDGNTVGSKGGGDIGGVGTRGGHSTVPGGPHVPLTLKVTSGFGPGSGGVSASPPKRSSAGRAFPPPGSPPLRPSFSSSAQRTGAGGGGGEAATSTLNWDQKNPRGGEEAQNGGVDVGGGTRGVRGGGSGLTRQQQPQPRSHRAPLLSLSAPLWPRPLRHSANIDDKSPKPIKNKRVRGGKLIQEQFWRGVTGGTSLLSPYADLNAATATHPDPLMT